MGATTKSGRTRNRRALSLSAPPAGWPQTLALLKLGQPTANTMTFQAITTAQPNWPGTVIVGGGTAVLWDPDNEVEVPATIAINPATHVITITSSTAWPEGGGAWLFPPWQETVRGPNGEWIAATVLVIDPSP